MDKCSFSLFIYNINIVYVNRYNLFIWVILLIIKYIQENIYSNINNNNHDITLNSKNENELESELTTK